jgi:AraC-like DNA-binding protein
MQVSSVLAQAGAQTGPSENIYIRKHAKSRDLMNFSSSLGIIVLQVGWTKLGGWWNYTDLSAPYWRIYWNDSAGGELRFEGRKYSLNPNKIFLIAPNTSFSSIPPPLKSETKHFYIHFLIKPQFVSHSPSVFFFKSDETFFELIKETILLHEAKDIKAEIMGINLAARLISLIPIKSNEKKFGARAEKAIEILKNHCESGIANESLARKFSMSTNAFLRLFKKAAGTSPQKYLMNMRIERACFMLHYSDKSIKEIADLNGFCDRYHFTKTFKMLRNESPAKFRRKNYNAATIFS